jgi:ABC-type nickel/cobalt efflux system permease component RcnA
VNELEKKTAIILAASVGAAIIIAVVAVLIIQIQNVQLEDDCNKCNRNYRDSSNSSIQN